MQSCLRLSWKFQSFLHTLANCKVSPSCQFFILRPPKPYSVRPCRFSAYTTSMAVTVLHLACSLNVTASCITFSRKLWEVCVFLYKWDLKWTSHHFSWPNVLWPARLYPECCLLGFSCDVSRLLYPNLYHKTVYAHDSTWLEASIGHFSFSHMLIRGEFPWSIFEKLLKLMEKWVFVTSVNFFFQRSNTLWRSEINSAKKIALTLMRTQFTDIEL